MALLLLAVACPSRAGSSATIVVSDRLCLPGEEIFIEATLYGGGAFGLFQAGIQGELLRFLDPEGNPLRDLLTDASGLARIRYRAGQPGRYPFTVHLVGNPRYSADPSTGNLFVQDAKLPLLFVTVEEGLMPPRSTSLLPKDPRKVEPQPGSVRALCEVAPCHVLVYLTLWSRPSSRQIRFWLETKGYPPGAIYFVDRPLLSGIVTKEPAPKTELLESLWKERSVPACLATRDRSLAGAAAGKEIRVLLLGSEETNRSVPAEEKSEKRIAEVEDWAEVAELCRCGAVASKDTPFHEE
jgi:hypothetical protein